MRTTLKGLAAAVAAMVAVVGSAAGAGAGPVLDEAGTALRRDPVYVHPDAEPRVRDAVSTEVQRLRDAIRAGDTPLFIAVLPAEAVREVGTEREAVNRVPGALRQASGLAGTYAVVVGTEFRAASDVVRGVGGMATSAFQQRRQEGVAAVLADFVGRVQRAAATTGAGGREPAAADRSSEREPARSSGAGSGWLVVILFFAGALGLVFWMSRRSPRARRGAAGRYSGGDSEWFGYADAGGDVYRSDSGYGDGYSRGPFGTTRFDPDKARLDLRADLQMLGDDVLALEPDVALSPEARTEYDAGVARYRWAEAAIAAMDSPDDVPRIRRALAEGNYAMARARAIARGDPPPPPPAELTRRGPNDEPAVEIDDDGRPAYAGYRNQGGGWFGGGFFGGNDLFTGLLLGQMLGGMFGGWGGGGGGFERGYNEGYDRGQAEGERSSGSDAGWGGGDFGGGDFGGGGFDGGDVGGGDF